MADQIRTVYFGREAVEGTLAVSPKNLPFTKAGFTPAYTRITPKVHNGTRHMYQTVRRGTNISKFQITIPGYFDQLGYLLSVAFGSPTSAGVSMATGAFDHTFKAGGSSVPTASIQWYNGVDWWQMLGCSVESMSANFETEKLPEFTFNFVGRDATKISAPSNVNQSIAAYSQPWDIPQAAVTLGGAGYALLQSGKFDIKFGRDPLHTIGSASMVRALEGEVEGTVNLAALYTAYTGSIVEDYIANTAPGSLVIVYTSTADMIGTGTPVAVAATFTIPSILLTSGEPDESKINVVQQIKGLLGYNTSDATICKYVLRNEVGLTGYDGS